MTMRWGNHIQEKVSYWIKNKVWFLSSYDILDHTIENYGVCLGAVSIRKTVLPGMAIPMLKIRRPNGRLIFNMEIAIRR